MPSTRFSLFASIIAVAIFCLHGTPPYSAPAVALDIETPSPPLPEDEEVIWVRMYQDSTLLRVLHSPGIFTEYWDTLPQPRFWHRVMKLSEDSSLVNIAASREVVGYVDTETYDDWKSETRKAFKDSIVKRFSLEKETQLYVTSGKRFYYQFQKALPVIDQGIRVFDEQGTDAWYAQTILLIESPGQLARSSAGAYGSFQLLKGVGIANGLTINKTVDEREDPEKSAAAAARFIKNTCIPKAKSMLAPYGLRYRETDMWFRLLVLHVYHAGAGNVAGVIRKIAPSRGGPDLIRRVWRTQYKNFGNASQNYSQVALASLIELDRIVTMECEYICPAERP